MSVKCGGENGQITAELNKPTGVFSTRVGGGKRWLTLGTPRMRGTSMKWGAQRGWQTGFDNKPTGTIFGTGWRW